jgi:GMP synthase-like glutamine amidotransferase
MRVLVVQHDHVSPPGPVGERFADRGYEPVAHPVVPEELFHAPNVAVSFPDPADYDAVVAMGAPWSVYDQEMIGEWVGPELAFLRQAHRAGVPVLGICFGGQLLAQAHGGRVTRSSTPELGWCAVESDDEALVPGGPWFAWHYDGWTLPPDAVEVARNAAASQAFVLGRNLAVQFHPELGSAMLDGWLRNGGDRLAVEFGLDPGRLLEQTRERDEEGRRRAHRLVDAFLDRVAARPAALSARADVATDTPARYAKQLVSHLGRKLAFTTDGPTSTARLGDGTARIVVGDGVLTLLAEAPDSEDLERVKDVLGRHLERFGARNELAVTWTAG